MSRPQAVLAVLIGTLLLAAFALLAPHDRPTFAQAPASADLPSGLVLDTPEMPLGVEGALLDLNRSLSAGLQPADNAAVLLVQVFGADVFESELRGASLDMLGIRSLAKSPRFQYVEQFVRSRGAAKADDVDRQVGELNEGIALGIEQPWTRDQRPSLAEFLAANAAALDLVVVAADRPGYYAPLLSQEHPMRLMSAAFSIEHRLPFIARCLSARAMLRFAEDDVAGAAADLLACHKLAALLASGSPMDVSGAKAHIIDSIASHTELMMLSSGKLHGDQAATLLAAIAGAPSIATSDDAANRGERAILHQELELLRTDDESRLGFFETGSPEDLEQLQQLVNDNARWATILATADALQDKMVEALSIRPHAKQSERFAALDQEYAQWNAADVENERPFAELATTDPEAAAKSIGESMAMALRTNPWQRRHTDDRARMRRDSIVVGLALAAFRARHGTYPAELTELAPGILPSVPVDVFSESAFTYRRSSADRATIISLGANQVDDAGSIYNDDVIIELH